MAPRANWKGFLRLSLVTCPVALYPATSESEKVSFNQLNRATGHRIKYLKVDADTGDEVLNKDIVKGYKVDTDTFIEVTKEELDNVALESTRTIEIDEFVDRSEIDPRYLIRPYYLRPDGKVGHDAFAVIRETIREMGKVAIGRVVLTNREHIIALEPLDKGLMGTLLRYPYEVRDPKEYFDEIDDVKMTKDMLDLARHIVEQKSGSFEPAKFDDQYETALVDLINQKRAGKPIVPKDRPKGENVVDLMDALRKSVGGAAAAPIVTPKKPAKKAKKAAAGQKELLMPISGKKPAKDAAAKKPAAGVGLKHPVTPDGRYFVVRGRLWRMANPDLDEGQRPTLVKQLMTARRAVRDAKSNGDQDAEAAAHRAVDDAKRALGERGPVWWKDGSPDSNRHMAKSTPYAGWYSKIGRSRPGGS
jgi:DNA end-binding protein Ku